MRIPLLLLMGIAPLSAMASFELVMVSDYTSKSIHRFDGSTGVYLGSFGGGFLVSPESFNIDKDNGLAYVADPALALVRVFNYNTGIHLTDLVTSSSYGTWQTEGRAITGQLVDGYYAGGWQFHAPTGAYMGAVGSLPVGGTTANCMASAGHRSGRVIGASYHPSTAIAALQTFNLSTTAPGVVKSAEFADMGSWNTRSQIAVQDDRIAWFSANRQLRTFGITAAGTSLNAVSSFSMGGVFSATNGGIGFGHGSTVYTAGINTAGSSGIISRGVFGSNASITTFGAGILQNPGMMQVIVAPEPSSLAILSLGAVAILRRRRH